MSLLSTLALQQAIITTGLHDFSLLIIGIVILIIGIVANYILPNRLWMILVVIGVIIAIVGVFVLLFGPLW